VFLVAALSALPASAQTQQAGPPPPRPHTFGITSSDVAVTYTLERAKLQASNCNCFWLNGGSADAAITLYRGFGLAANLTGEHASNILPGVNLGKISFMAGPRYTYGASHTRVFGEWLFGVAHAFDGAFPGPTGLTASAGSFSTQLGIGTDIAIHKGLGVRAFEVDYVHTSLPNNGVNSQNDLRLAFGLSYRFGVR